MQWYRLAKQAKSDELRQLIAQLKAQYPGLDLDVWENNGGSIELAKIEVPLEMRHRGIGKRVVRAIQEYAKAHNQPVVLRPEPQKGYKAKLDHFYRDLGFVNNKGKNVDYALTSPFSRTMYWKPPKQASIKTAKFLNEHSAWCAHCSGQLGPKDIVVNPKHIYPIGTIYSCKCGKSKIWANSIRDEEALLAFLNNQPNRSGEVRYYQGFCNDKYCGYCFNFVYPLQNGYAVPWSDVRLDRYGCEKCKQNQYILMDLYKEGKENDTAPIMEWYREQKDKVRGLI